MIFVCTVQHRQKLAALHGVLDFRPYLQEGALVRELISSTTNLLREMIVHNFTRAFVQLLAELVQHHRVRVAI